jgi:ABC-type multidrug transport system ATPase subunit
MCVMAILSWMAGHLGRSTAQRGSSMERSTPSIPLIAGAASSSGGKGGGQAQALFWTQLKVVLRKNLALSRRNPKALKLEVLLPVFCLVVVVSAGTLNPLLITVIFSLQVRVLLVLILEEKERKLREAMLMVGLKPIVNSLGHLLTSFAKGLLPIFVLMCFKSKMFPGTDASLALVFLLVFALNCYCFAFVISTFFSTAKTGANFGYFIYIVAGFAGEVLPLFNGLNTGIVKGLVAGIPAVGFSTGLSVIASAESNPQVAGVTWANMGNITTGARCTGARGWDAAGVCRGIFDKVEPPQEPPVTFEYVLTWQVLCIFLYTVLLTYLERVVPNEHGTTLPWHFPFHPSWWRDGTIGDGQQTDRNDQQGIRPSGLVIEDVDPDVVGPSAVSITGLSKRFKAKAEGVEKQADKTKWLKAVDNLSLDMYEGQITALLGHNGAGKSTTISMLTGLYPPTSGTATLYDQDLATQMVKVRQLMGVCPQHDVIWPLLTVAEHLELFAAIKGAEPDAAKHEAARLIADVGLADKRDERAQSLSGGMKRRLSCALALIGSPRVVYLDEPTSGLDPQARRQIWALLEKSRAQRVTVLTTHFMDEADILGDRIAIMSAGKLRCAGSSLFLKNRFGVGYHLTLSKASDATAAQSSAMVAAVQRFVPSAKLQTDVAGEITMLLPLDQVASFPALLDHIEANLGPFGLSSYAMSVSTLEEVFLKIAELDHAAEAKRLVAGGVGEGGEGNAAFGDEEQLGRRSGSSLGAPIVGAGADQGNFGRGCVRAPFGRQVRSLVIKRMLHARRDKKQLMLQFGIPVLGLLLAYLMSYYLGRLATSNVDDDEGKQAINDTLAQTFSFFMAYFFCYSCINIGAIGGTNIVAEKESGVKRQLLVGGVRLSAYWVANLAFDCMFFFGTWLIVITMVQATQLPYWSGGNSGAMALLFLLFGPAISAWSYSFTSCFKKSTSYQTVALTGGTFLLLGFAMGGRYLYSYYDGESGTWQNVLQFFGFMLMPSFTLFWGLFKLALSSALCDSARRFNSDATCAGPLDWGNAGKPILFLLASTALHLAITLAIEWRRWQIDVGAAATAGGESGSAPADEDEDVAAERQRVGQAGATVNRESVEVFVDVPGVRADNIQVRSLTKVFPGSALRRPAVANITFGIPEGECFGLLGPNGAGKTTTLGMLTGDVRPTSGSASLRGLDVGTQLSEIFGTVGFCPQFDALPGLLTGREVLTMYAGVKGVPPARVAAVVNVLLEKMTLARHADKCTKTYSGGNKRKLSLAAAMMGDPKIIFLDEPSTGMDPQARRAMWDVICSATRGRSIILTTHLMEEAEALCQRIGIVVKGRLACLGSVQHLKKRFGKGYTVELKTSDVSKVPQVQEFIASLAPEAILGEHHGGHLNWQLPKAGISLAALFRKFEASKTELDITEYAVAQTSLEQVFLRFAREQELEQCEMLFGLPAAYA